MARTALRVGSLLVAGLLGVLLTHVLGVPWWGAPLAAVACWVILTATVGIVRFRVTAHRLRHEGADGRTRRALEAVAALESVSGGNAGFTRDVGDLAALEHAVLFGAALPPRRGPARARLEAAIRDELARSSPAARGMLVEGFAQLVDAGVRAATSPLDALHPAARTILSRLAVHDPAVDPRALSQLVDRSPSSRVSRWAQRRDVFDAAQPETALAVRLLAAGFGKSALDALRLAPGGGRVDRLRRLARCASLLADAEGGRQFLLPPDVVARWHAELLLLAGRRLPDLSPGSGLLRVVPGGAASLERAVANTPIAVAQFAELARTHPELQRQVAIVIARIMSWPVGSVVNAMREGTLSARPDSALRLHLRGLALLEEGRVAEAAAEFEGALLQAPDFAQAAFALAATRRRSGAAGDGESVLRAVADERPDDPEPVLFLARYLSAIGERDRARSEFERGVKRFPSCVPLRVAFAQELVAWGCGAEAADQLDTARRDHPDDPRLALFAGRTLATESRLDEAARALEKAARMLTGQERAEAWFWLMGVRRDQGDHVTAERIARRLINALGAGQSGLLDDVADYLEERHDFLRAREAAERARRLRESGDGTTA